MNSVFVIFVAFCADLFCCGRWDHSRLIDFPFYLCAFASLREIRNPLSVGIKVFRCGYEYAG
jgi:hypothetical protein